MKQISYIVYGCLLTGFICTADCMSTNTPEAAMVTPSSIPSPRAGNRSLVLNETLLVFNGNKSRHIESILSGESYNKEVRPYAGEGRPTKVHIALEVKSVSDVSEVNMAIKLTVILKMIWTDPRLSYTGVNTPFTLSHNLYDRLWIPDLYFSNEDDGFFHALTVPNRLIRLSPDGTILLSQRFSMTLSCFMQLQYYPLDNQTCPIYLESYGYVKDELVFEWLDGDLKLNDQLVLAEFSITGTSLGTCTSKSVTGDFTCLIGNICLQREKKFYFVQVYVPSILLVVLSWVSFWIDAKSAPARVTLGLITVLTITTQSSGISSRLPKVSYIKAIDVWMSTCLMFVFAAFIEYAIVNVGLNKKWNRQKTSGVDKNYADVELGDLEANKWNSKDSIFPDSSTTNSTEHLKPAKIGIKLKIPCCENSYISVDKVSRLLFPLSFIIFNIIYWLYYLHFL